MTTAFLTQTQTIDERASRPVTAKPKSRNNLATRALTSNVQTDRKGLVGDSSLVDLN
jgi:hypothetical protein